MIARHADGQRITRDELERSIDIPFSVPCVHRLRVTEDVMGADFDQLLGVLDAGQVARAKVLVVAEEALREPAAVIHRRLSDRPEIELVGPPAVIGGGEAVKNSTAAAKQVLGRIHDGDLDRRSYVIAIGGGAMLDAVGYAAAVAHRGIRLVRLPTTTLAQADSGVGVKNAINYFGKKNWVGTFAVPWAVINDATLLQSLSDRDFRSGFSEAVKVALLKDADQFHWLCRHAARIRARDPQSSQRAIQQSCLLHLRHITAGGDPFETREARPLDFGHWSAHRLESLTDYQIRHGEAVGIGVALDCLYSMIQHGLDEPDAWAVCRCLASLGLPLWHEELLPIDRLITGLEEFRQHLGGRLTLTLLRGVGDPIDVHEVDRKAMEQALGKLRQWAEELAADV